MGDPNYKMSQSDYDDQVGFLMQVKNKFSEIQTAIKNIRNIRSQLTDLKSRTKDKEITQLADSINKQITSVEEALYQTNAKSSQDVLNYPIRLNNKILNLYSFANSGYNPPAQQVKDAYKELAAQADKQLDKFRQVLQVQLPQLNKLVHDRNVTIIGLKE